MEAKALASQLRQRGCDVEVTGGLLRVTRPPKRRAGGRADVDYVTVTVRLRPALAWRWGPGAQYREVPDELCGLASVADYLASQVIEGRGAGNSA